MLASFAAISAQMSVNATHRISTGRSGRPPIVKCDSDPVRAVNAMMNTLKMPEDMPIEAKLLTGVIEKSQERVEGANFARRKHVLEYDDVMNKQRELIYDQRRKVLDDSDLKDTVLKMMDDYIEAEVQRNLAGEDTTLWNFDALHQAFDGMMITPEDLQYTAEELMELDPAEVAEMLKEKGMPIF